MSRLTKQIEKLIEKRDATSSLESVLKIDEEIDSLINLLPKVVSRDSDMVNSNVLVLGG